MNLGKAGKRIEDESKEVLVSSIWTLLPVYEVWNGRAYAGSLCPMRSRGVRLKYLGGFQRIELDSDNHTDVPFLDADKIVQIISNGEVSIQAHPEDNLEPLLFTDDGLLIYPPSAIKDSIQKAEASMDRE